LLYFRFYHYPWFFIFQQVIQWLRTWIWKGQRQDIIWKYNSYYKSKDSNVIVKKIKCTNINNNINGDIIGDVSVGNGQVGAAAAEDERDSSVGSFGGNDDQYNGYDSGYTKDKDFVCIINNNNNNIRGDNATDGNGNETEICEDCFLPTTEGGPIPPNLLFILTQSLLVIPAQEIEGFSDILETGEFTEDQLRDFLENVFEMVDAQLVIDQIIGCLISLGLISPPP
jgi:hypothetical protein